jgi:hypothetical protein
VLALLLAISLASSTAQFEDAWIRLELPKGWTIEGESGEYMLDSDSEDIGSLLILSPDTERSMEERLADIEEQFISTGLFTLESVEERDVDGSPVHVRRYRRSGATGDPAVTIHHQYSFTRSESQVLLQIETGEKSASPDRLFQKVFSTLEILGAPEPFLYEDYWEEGNELEEEILEDLEEMEMEEPDSLSDMSGR